MDDNLIYILNDDKQNLLIKMSEHYNFQILYYPKYLKNFGYQCNLLSHVSSLPELFLTYSLITLITGLGQ